MKSLDKTFMQLIVSASIILLFYFLHFVYLVDLPSYDDYDTTLNFLLENPEFTFSSLIHPHNDHLIFFTRAIAVTYFNLFHVLSFKNLVLIQNIFLFGNFILILWITKIESIRFQTILILITIYLFNLSFWSSSFYFSGGSQHFVSTFFTILTLICLHQTNQIKSYFFLLSIIFATLSVISFGNGIIVIPLTYFLLFDKERKNILILWFVFCTGLGFLFLLNHNSEKSIISLNMVALVKFYFTFLGSFLYVEPNTLIWKKVNIYGCFGVGVFVFAQWLYLIYCGYAFKKKLLFSLFSMPIFTGVLLALGRCDGTFQAGLTARYMYFSTLIPVALILILVNRTILSKWAINVLIGLVMLSYCLTARMGYTEFTKANQDIVERYDAWLNNKNIGLVFFQPTELRFGKTLEESIKKGIIDPPKSIKIK